MVDIFNAISDIAKVMENKVFSNYDDFIGSEKSIDTVNNDILKFSRDLIENTFSSVKIVKGTIDQDTKVLNTINSDDNAKYIISYVPIDNISLLDLNFSLGTIFGVYENNLETNKMVASCYITYGPTLQLVFATKSKGVQFFSYDGQNFIEEEHFQLDNKGKINSTAGDVATFDNKHKLLMQGLFDEGYRLRFSDSLVLDTHQILFKRGGLYSSPVTKNVENGILNLLFEASPISFIVECAGGYAINGVDRILDLRVENDLNKKTPIYFGSSYEIDLVKKSFN